MSLTEPMDGAKPTHVDDWAFEAAMSQDEGEQFAAFFFHHKRLRAFMQNTFSKFLPDMRLFCDYQGTRYRVTGASRMGDVWLAKDFERDRGYDLRVIVNECSGWSRQP